MGDKIAKGFMLIIGAAVIIGIIYLGKQINYWLWYDGTVEAEVQKQVEPLERRIEALELKLGIKQKG